jgi:hypothetical protein
MKVNRSPGATRILSLSPSPFPVMPTRSRLRRLAAYVLLVWLFGLASGIVNACVLGSELRHAPHAAMHQVDGDEHALADHSAGGHAAHEHQSNQKPPCERLCDAPAARAADKDLGSVLAGFWIAPAPLPAVHMRPLVSERQPVGHVEQPWRVAVPLPIAYQRLTL